MRKIITFAVPCHNSASYMDHCIETLLTAGEDAEIILIDDGSTKDDTPAKCDAWANQYPNIIRTIHQENGGHGEGVNQGLRHATGIYYKVVDSDDWLDISALAQVMDKLREFSSLTEPFDMVIANYVYEHAEDNTQRSMGYKNALPVNRVFSWKEIGRFLPSQCLLMHSVIYRTALLRECGIELPKHTFYVDNIFVYQPLPHVKTMYYMNLDLYRYFIGRADQSVNEAVMASRIDQQIRITQIMIDSHDLMAVKLSQPQLGRYMLNYLSMMMCISSVFAILADKPEALKLREELWEHLRRKDLRLYRRCRRTMINIATNLPGTYGRKLSVQLYRLAQRLFKFN